MGRLCPISEPAPARPGRAVIALLVVAALATAFVNGFNLVERAIWHDDFQILAQSWTWQKTSAGLWVPQNEHTMPLGRLLTYALDLLAGTATNLPLAAAVVGPVALLLGLPLVHRLVSR